MEVAVRRLESPELARALAVAAAGLLGFALPGGAMLMMLGPFNGWIFLSLFAAVPAAAIALMPFGARILCFVLGLLGTAATWLLDSSGPDNPMILLPWIAWCLTGAALLAELCLRGFGRLARPPPSARYVSNGETGA